MTITLCVPTIGREKYLKRVQACIEGQTRKPDEILVLDNASPMEFVKRHLEPWAQSNARVELLRVDPRIPMFSNFNRGIRAAKHPLIAFMHDDDFYDARFLEEGARALETHPSAGFVGTNYDFIDDQDRITEKRRWIANDELVSGRTYIDRLLKRGRNLIPMPGVMFRKDAVHNGFDENISIHFGDFVLLMRIAEFHDVCLLARPLVQIRRHEEQASNLHPFVDGLEMRDTILRNYLDEYAARWPSEQQFVKHARERLQRLYFVGLVWASLREGRSVESAQAIEHLRRLPKGGLAAAGLKLMNRLGVSEIARRKQTLAVARRCASWLHI